MDLTKTKKYRWIFLDPGQILTIGLHRKSMGNFRDFRFCGRGKTLRPTSWGGATKIRPAERAFLILIKKYYGLHFGETFSFYKFSVRKFRKFSKLSEISEMLLDFARVCEFSEMSVSSPPEIFYMKIFQKNVNRKSFLLV